MEEHFHTLQAQHHQAQRAAQAAYASLEQQFKEKEDLLKTANDHIDQLEMDKDALLVYKAQYHANADAFMRASVGREIHMAWVEGKCHVLREQSVRLYQGKHEAEGMVALAQRQGFVVVPGNAQALQ